MPTEAHPLGVRTELDVPMPARDGTILRANIFRPEIDGRFPGIVLRTPYGKPAGGYERYVRAGYVVLAQDARGRYASDGDFVIFSEEHTQDGEDGYDTVQWLAAQPYCDGNVGGLGCSYNAWMQWMLAGECPPSLKAICAYSIPLELIEVDWWGAFRPGRRIRWWLTTMAPDLRKRAGMPPPHTPAQAVQVWDELEHGRWLGLLPWADIVQFLPPPLAQQVDSWLREPNRQAWRFDELHAKVRVPNLDFSGWFDHCNGSLMHLSGMQNEGATEIAREQTRLVAGPWNHVGLGQRQIGDIDFGPQAALDLPDMIIRWFDHWLKGIDNGVDRDPAVRYFVMGAGQWKSALTWPPKHTTPVEYHLRCDEEAGSGGLAGEPPGHEPPDEYIYDPRDPVPTLWTRALFTGVSDRSKLAYRRDILNYRTPPLTEDVEIAGYPQVILYASSSAPDTDFFARLVDEHPDGKALEVCYGLVRARHRNSLDEEDLLTPGEVTEFRIRLGATACRFLAGHRIRLEITSSDFPNHDRNHNTGRNDLFDAELIPATQLIFHTGDYPSRVILPVDAEATRPSP